MAQEYGTYVAAEAIYLGGARAFNPGDPVPVSHVERGVVHPDQVRKADKVPAGETPEPKKRAAAKKAAAKQPTPETSDVTDAADTDTEKG